MTVRHGQTHALVGESGCGKTATLRIALGLEAPTSGSIVLVVAEIAHTVSVMSGRRDRFASTRLAQSV